LRHVVGGYGRGGVALGPRRFGARRGIATTVNTITVANTVTDANIANTAIVINTVTVADIATVANPATTVAGFVGAWAA